MRILKGVLLILLFFSKITSFSQNNNICGEIYYKEITNFDFEYFEYYKMTFMSNWSYSEEVNIKYFNDSQKNINSDKGMTTAHIVGRKDLTPKFYYNNKAGFYFRDNFSGEILIVKEKPFDWTWKLLKETKKIGNFTCNKASIKFRGRSYIGWYTNEIPVRFGPWKFQGLPGLILEVYDQDKVFHIIVNKVILKRSSGCELKINNKELKNSLDIKTYLKKKDRIIDLVFAKMSSKLPKGSKPLKRDKNCEDCKQDVEIFNEKD